MFLLHEFQVAFNYYLTGAWHTLCFGTFSSRYLKIFKKSECINDVMEDLMNIIEVSQNDCQMV